MPRRAKRVRPSSLPPTTIVPTVTTIGAIAIVTAVMVTACATVETVRDVVYDGAWEVGLRYCRAPEARRQTYRDGIADELTKRAAAEPAGTMVPKDVALTCGLR